MKRVLSPSAHVGGLIALLTLLSAAGCGRNAESATSTVPVRVERAGALPGDEEILRQIDEALDFTFERRRLSVNEQAAWQIIHGAVAFGRDFLVSDGEQDVSAVDYVLAGGRLRGWDLRRGDLLDEATQRHGVKALVPEDKEGQGHADQWMGYLSGCGLPLDEPIVVEGARHTIADYLDQIQLDVDKNPLREYSWTLMALTAYYPTDHTWQAKDGSTWSIEKLVEIELEHSLDDSPCGGTHRMTALTMAYNRHKQAGRAIEGVWRQLEERIQKCVSDARMYQNPDGSLSSNYFLRPGKSADLAICMGSAGHVLEFLTTALDEEQLQEEWVKRAVLDVCKLFRQTKPIDVECGALFHAAHGLVLYREKVYGPRTFGRAAEDAPASQSGTPIRAP